MNIASAIDTYHELLATDPAAAWEQLQAAMQADRLYFGTRPICSVLRPHFMSPAAYAYLVEVSEILRRALGRAYEVVRQDAALRSRIGVSAGEEYLLSLQPDAGPGDASGRLDAFYLSDAAPDATDAQSGGHPILNFVEYNAESPGGLAFGEALSAMFRDLPLFAGFERLYRVRSFTTRHLILDQLLAGYRAQGGRGRPRIAIVDWRTARTYREFELCHDYFAAQGLEVRILDPDELEQNAAGRLVVGDFEIDVVYKRVVTTELLLRYGIDHPLIRAVGQGTVCMVNSFNPVLLFNKGLFALLSDEAFAARLGRDPFEPLERLVIGRHLPWTRLVAEGQTTFERRQVDLLEFASNERSRLVLKPTNDYGGKGVLLGWECDQATWDGALRSALHAPHILQVRVPVPQTPFPSLIDGRLDISPRLVDVDPYVWRCADIDGAGVRLSTTSLLNVSAGGGSAVPLFVVERR